MPVTNEGHAFEAEREVERILADAHAQADVIKSEAEAQARKVVDDGRVRKERLREEARLIEDRIVWAHEGLREVSARLAEGRSDPLDGLRDRPRLVARVLRRQAGRSRALPGESPPSRGLAANIIVAHVGRRWLRAGSRSAASWPLPCDS